jgi:hypothetical protein
MVAPRLEKRNGGGDVLGTGIVAQAVCNSVADV